MEAPTALVVPTLTTLSVVLVRELLIIASEKVATMLTLRETFLPVGFALITVGAVVSLTVRTKVSVASRSPSLTAIVMVAVPDLLATGVTVSVRFSAEPRKVMLELGTRAVFDELPLSVRSPAGVSTSPTVKGIAAVGLPASAFWSAMSEMLGA